MSHAARELESDVMRALYEEGARPLEKGYDGAGHQTVVFEFNRQTITFHYASTGRLNGHCRRNITARLRRIIREIPEPPPEPPRPQDAAPPVSTETMVETRPILPPPPTPPSPTRMTLARRKEAVKRYLSLDTIEQLCEEYDLTEARAIALLLSSRGQSADKARLELTKRRMEAARLRREAATIAKLSKSERDRLIAEFYFERGMTAKEIGDKFGLAPSTIGRIARG